MIYSRSCYCSITNCIFGHTTPVDHKKRAVIPDYALLEIRFMCFYSYRNESTGFLIAVRKILVEAIATAINISRRNGATTVNKLIA